MTNRLPLVCWQDIQAEIDAHNDIYKSVDGNKSKMVKALGSSEEAVFLQHRLDDMNQRWSDLKAKSANIRSVLLHPVTTHRDCFFYSPNHFSVTDLFSASVLNQLGHWMFCSRSSRQLDALSAVGTGQKTSLYPLRVAHTSGHTAGHVRLQRERN